MTNKIVIIKNERDIEEWLNVAKFSHYPENTQNNKVTFSEEFRQEITDAVKDFKTPFLSPTILAIKDASGSIIATASVRKEEHLSNACQIKNVAVHPEFRRLGIGRLLINQIEKFVYDNSNYEYITLTTGSSKTFYEKIGMTLAGVLDFGEIQRYFFYKKIKSNSTKNT